MRTFRILAFLACGTRVLRHSDSPRRRNTSIRNVLTREVVCGAAFAACVMFASPVYAVMRAPIQSATALQPIPANIQPDVSHSVQRSETYNDEQNVAQTESAPAPEAPAPTTPNTQSHGGEIFVAIAAIIIIGAGVFTVVRKTER